MKIVTYLCCSFLFMSARTGIYGQSTFKHFVASTPCSSPSRPVPGIPTSEEVELIQWDLRLSLDNKSAPTFSLLYVFGIAQPNTHGITGGGTRKEMYGSWKIVSETTGEHRKILQLTDKVAGIRLSFVMLGDHILHLLDQDGHLMIGTAGWSYTFNEAPAN